mmetsp:Transcript_73016/g.136379  ORF Transcript_73016/g.136379 Transcript_73016/m.136379 type:complete len:147 (+) Transcript_73016:96-536(+)
MASKPILQCAPVWVLLLVALAPYCTSSLQIQDAAEAMPQATYNNRTAESSPLEAAVARIPVSAGEGLDNRGDVGKDNKVKVSTLAKRSENLDASLTKAGNIHVGPYNMKCLLGLTTLVMCFVVTFLACGIVVIPSLLLHGKKRGQL